MTTLAVANNVNVYRISKQKGAGGVAFSDEPVVDFPLVRYLHVVHVHDMHIFDTSLKSRDVSKQLDFQ